ncbi:phenylalanine--tRNA ligase subunit beta [Aquifex aeolicus]|uniref:Phenylalanine--tRNA ligase beta subunit n=1 Tax=Aquifex aeolicus (strain VF5) TaxID=224324 RepID=SYFB_AQUAE|nr:phenylalanine--tRNA ligase subunit beta [Aquifex aeolicus]O67620.1 RecName: Full=Phenylalanine--tRNA ligase beta subunit; AltName: Full=Phenylalanyl-tRNA synthetase beta subunit; Short=PheRS [Aquifex aeolicus VF5]AAC07582.1 phenylalanyl-tRNA synthetase beta subunit [Aquifex aeolicus VF5]
MKVPYSWLSEFVELSDVSPEEIAEKLSLRSVEATVETFGIDLDGVVFGKVVEVKEHPTKKKLAVVKVQVQEHIFIDVVTVDKSVREGDGVIVALPNAKVGNMCVTEREFDGVVSKGLLLSAQELGLEEKSEGVLKIHEDFKPGTDANEILGFGEKIIEIDITPNRGDMLSVRGVARDLSAIFRLPKKKPEEPTYEETGEFFIEIEDEDCKRYRGVVIEGVEIKESPLYIKKRLWQCGIKSINNVVDITNYVMLRDGQPLHAFDLSKVEGGIIVRSAKKGEKIITLDGEERELDEDILVIADREKPLAVAGVIGGLESGIKENTKDILLESAYFNPFRVRKASKKLGIQTESSYRFERNVDIERVDRAQDYAVYLILKHAGGKVKVVKDVYREKYKPKKVFLPQGKYIRYAGESYKNEEVKEILDALEIPNEIMRCGVEVLVPSHRSFDIQRDVDLIEEIMRVKGYEHYTSETLKLPSIANLWKDNLLEVKKYLRDKGLTEVINFSFEDSKLYELLNLPLPELEVINPLNPTQRYMRNTLITSLLRTAVYNDRNYNYDQAVFELGKVFFKEGEENRLGILLKGNKPRTLKEEKWEPYDLTEIIAGIFALFGLEPEFRNAKRNFLHPYVQGEVYLEGEFVGFFGKLHPKIAKELELKGEPFVAEIEIERVLSKKRLPHYREVAKFPPVVRDIALVMDKELDVNKLLIDTKSQIGELLEEVRVFDVYTGEKVGEGKKSVAVRLVLRSKTGSLKDEEANELVNKLVNYLKEKYGVELRT